MSAPRVIKQHIFPSLCIDPKIRDPLALITGSQKESSSTMTEAASILLLDTLHLLRQILKTSRK